MRHVINYDCPSTSEGYVHRIGRTGRAGSEGVAHTMITADDARCVHCDAYQYAEFVDAVSRCSL